jgi:hypothetical protein
MRIEPECIESNTLYDGEYTIGNRSVYKIGPIYMVEVTYYSWAERVNRNSFFTSLEEAGGSAKGDCDD